jgi:hypothetical protein
MIPRFDQSISFSSFFGQRYPTKQELSKPNETTAEESTDMKVRKGKMNPFERFQAIGSFTF